MIQPQDLRIGNGLYHTHEKSSGEIVTEVVCVHGIKYSNAWYIENLDKWIGLEDIRPIPLTKEWLLKFGFDICNTVGGFEKWELSNGFRLLDGKPPALKACQPVQYVHQLQNLYFAMTQTELTLTV